MGAKLTAEFIGTFWLVLGGCGSAVLAAAFPDVGIGLLGVSLAFGLTVLSGAYAFGPVSGGHFNPAVSAGLWAGGRFSSNELVPYVVAQVLGAVAGAAVLALIATGKPGFELVASGFAANGFGEHSPGKYGYTAGLVTEVVMTFMFLLVILGATHRKAPTGFAGLAIGMRRIPGSAWRGRRPRARLEPCGDAIRPAREPPVDVGPRHKRRRVGTSRAVDSLRQQHARLRVDELALDDGGVEEGARLRIQRIAAGRDRLVARRDGEHVEHGVGGVRLRDRQTDAQNARAGAVDERQAATRARSHRLLEVVRETEEVVGRHRIERLAPAAPDRDGLDHHRMIARPIGGGVPVHEPHLVRSTGAQQPIVVEEPRHVRRCRAMARRACAGTQQEEKRQGTHHADSYRSIDGSHLTGCLPEVGVRGKERPGGAGHG